MAFVIYFMGVAIYILGDGTGLNLSMFDSLGSIIVWFLILPVCAYMIGLWFSAYVREQKAKEDHPSDRTTYTRL